MDRGPRDRRESNNRARLAFRGLSPAGCPFPVWARHGDPSAPPIDFAGSFDSLDIMEKVMRHFYLRALIEELAEHESPLISRASPR
jgi:hypothetical protein